MEITVNTENARVPVHVMHIQGNIDSATYQDFQAKADELIAGGASHLLIDFMDVPFISSAGLRTLHSIFNKLRALNKVNDDEIGKKMGAAESKSPYLKVCNLSSQVMEVFQLSGFETHIEIHKDTNAAIASF
jgi:anti-sigma B factor antagonist